MQTGIYMEARAHAMIGSLLELRQALDTIAHLADYIPTWRPVLLWARGEYHKATGDLAAARAELDSALKLLPPVRHIVWPWVVTSLADVILQQGDPRAARALAESALQQCSGIAVQPLTLVELERVVALAQAHLGGAEEAGRRLEMSIVAVASDLGGVPLGRLYEARAQIALLAGDRAAFKTYVKLTEELFRPGKHPALVARCEKLLEQGRSAGLDSRRTNRQRAAVRKNEAAETVDPSTSNTKPPPSSSCK
jgi:tetratricopeptide (TPR) repeat protein